MIMTKQGVDVSKWMRVNENLKNDIVGMTGMWNLVIDLLLNVLTGTVQTPSPYAFYTQDLMRVLFR